MADISMCTDKECTLKETCYRFKATPGYWQSYADFKQVNGKCDYYWQLKEKNNGTRR